MGKQLKVTTKSNLVKVVLLYVVKEHGLKVNGVSMI